MKKQDQLTSFFRDRISNVEPGDEFLKENWAAMTDMLENKERKRVIFNWKWMSGVAAILLLGIGLKLFVFKSASTDNEVVPSGKRDESSKVLKPVRPELKAIFHTNNVLSKNNHRVGIKRNNHLPLSSEGEEAELIKSFKPEITLAEPYNNYADHLMQTIDSLPATSIIAIAAKPINLDSSRLTSKIAVNKAGWRPTMSFAILLGQDENGISTFGGQKGTNLGARFSINISRKINLLTGATYAITPYATDFEHYRSSSPGWWMALGGTLHPSQISADCRILEIPFAVEYNLFNRHTNRFSAGLGLSSYFMVSENYKFMLAAAGTGPQNLEFHNQNQHLLSIIDMHATYTHQLSSRMGILIQPYYRLPLTGIGFGKVDLHSAGIATGVNWMFGSFNKH